MPNVKYIKPRVWEDVVDLIYRMSDMAKEQNKTVKCNYNGVMITVTPESDPSEVFSDWNWARHNLSFSK